MLRIDAWLIPSLTIYVFKRTGRVNVMTKNRAKDILRILRNNFTLPSWPRASRHPFQTLIRTVLSQATADKNTHRAFGNLSTRFPITPKALAKADVRDIEKAIMVAGLYRNKSEVIKNLSRIILEDFNGSMDFIYSMPFGLVVLFCCWQ